MVLKAKSHVWNFKNHFEAQRLRIFIPAKASDYVFYRRWFVCLSVCYHDN